MYISIKKKRCPGKWFCLIQISLYKSLEYREPYALLGAIITKSDLTKNIETEKGFCFILDKRKKDLIGSGLSLVG